MIELGVSKTSRVVSIRLKLDFVPFHESEMFVGKSSLLLKKGRERVMVVGEVMLRETLTFSPVIPLELKVLLLSY